MESRLRVGAYNVLAQCLSSSSYFPYASAFLKRKRRWPAVRAQLTALSGDVLLLTEVDGIEDYASFFREQGYGIVCKLRGTKPYGNAIAWREDRLRLVRSASLDLGDLTRAALAHAGGSAAAWVAGGDSTQFSTDSVAVYAALELLEEGGGERSTPPRGVVCSVSHLHWRPEAGVVRTAQAAAWLAGAADFVAAGEDAQAPPLPWPIILGGDANSIPGSGSHAVLVRAALPLSKARARGGAGRRLTWDTLSPGAPAASAEEDAAWLAWLSDCVAEAALVAEAWAPASSAPERGAEEAPTVSGGVAHPQPPAPLLGLQPAQRAGDPVLVSAYAAAARAGAQLHLVAADGGAQRGAVQALISHLPRVGQPSAYGVLAPSTAVEVHLAGGAAGGSALGASAIAPLNGTALRPDGMAALLALPLPPATEWALDVLAEPAFTTSTTDFTETLDYVLATPDMELGAWHARTRVLGVRALPAQAEGFGFIPSADHPSDHLPLLAEMQLTWEKGA